MKKQLKLKIKYVLVHLIHFTAMYWIKWFNSYAILDKLRLATRNQIRRGNAVRVGPQFFDL